MERLTERKMDYCQLMDCGITCTQKELCDDAAIYNKLRAYEDAEEQGLLVRLPCKVGDTVYIHWFIYDNVEIVEKSFSYRMIPYMGVTVFLTREEAEAALEKKG